MKVSRTVKYHETIDSNAKIFNEMTAKISSTDQPKVFLDVICTLEVWLRVDKAYYPEARSMIVTLLENAMMFLSRLLALKDGAHVEISQCPPEAQSQIFAYIKLLLTVKQYEYFFREDTGLQERLNNVLHTIWFNDIPQPVAFQSRHSTSSSPFTSAGLINTPESRAESVVDNSDNTSHSPTSPSQPESSEQVSKQPGCMTSSSIAQSQPIDATISRTVNQTEPTPNSHGPPSSQPSTQVVTSTPFDVLRRSRIMSKFNRDRLLSLAKIDKEGWKKSKTSRTPETNLLKGQSIRERSIETQTGSLPSSPLTPKVVVTRQTEQEPLWNPNPAVIDLSIREIDNVGNDAIPIKKVPPASVSPTSKPTPPSFGGSFPNKDVRSPIRKPREPTSTTVIPELPTQHVSASKSTSQQFHVRSVDDAPTHVTAPQQHVPETSVIKSHEGRRNDTQVTGVTNGRTTVFTQSSPPKPRREEEIRLIDSSKKFLLLSKNESRPVIASQLATQFVDVMQDFISVKRSTLKTLFNTPPTSDANSKTDPSPLKRTRSPTADGDMPSPVRRKLENLIPDIEDERRKFERPLSSKDQHQPCPCHPDTLYETICVLAGSEGPSNQNISFEIEDDQLVQAQRWADRHTSFDKSLPSLSFTLTCAVAPDMSVYPEEKSGDDILRSLPIEWPQGGGLFITIQADETPPTSFAIAPPFWIRNYEPLDLTPCIGLKTTITITSDRGFSKYVFALRVHPPTDAQLREFHRASSLLSSSPSSDACPALWPTRPLSPIRSLFADLSL